MFISRKKVEDMIEETLEYWGFKRNASRFPSGDLLIHSQENPIDKVSEKLDWLIEYLGLEFYEETTQKNATIIHQKGFRKIKGRQIKQN